MNRPATADTSTAAAASAPASSEGRTSAWRTWGSLTWIAIGAAVLLWVLVFARGTSAGAAIDEPGEFIVTLLDGLTFAGLLFGLLGAAMPSLDTVKTLWRAWRAGGLPLLYDLGQLLLSSPREFLDRHFRSEKLKATMAAWGLHLDFPPDIAGGALFPYLESMANQAFGMVIGAGGADTIVNAMTRLVFTAGAASTAARPPIAAPTSAARSRQVASR